ncbi:MAG: hypothetical protein ABSD20_21330 [Terriglobales bacterium]|jgi:hypothetical protein
MRNIYFWISIAVMAAALMTGSVLVWRSGVVAHAADHDDEVMVPKFEVDPSWPKPLPNHWILGMTVGVAVDAHDNVWIVHRPQTLDEKESYLTRGQADCCTAAPDVLEFDPAGNLIRHWGMAEGHDWPSSNHGITIDSQGNVWLGGNGAYQPGPPAGSAAQFAAPPAPETAISAHRVYHDSFILKFSQDGKFLGEIGRADASQGSLDTKNVKGVAEIRFIPRTLELIAADGYGNHRVSVWNADTLQFIRMWGAYGHTPSDDLLPMYNPESPQFGNPVHCAVPSNDGLIYVCDRKNLRVQIFKYDGTFVKQFVLEPHTRGDGSAFDITFSPDPEQKFMYIADGSNMKIHVFDRLSLKELYSFGDGGRQPGEFYAVHNLVTDSKGDIFTTETYHGQRVQKFVYKGLVPLSKVQQGGVSAIWPSGEGNE